MSAKLNQSVNILAMIFKDGISLIYNFCLSFFFYSFYQFSLLNNFFSLLFIFSYIFILIIPSRAIGHPHVILVARNRIERQVHHVHSVIFHVISLAFQSSRILSLHLISQYIFIILLLYIFIQ